MYADADAFTATRAAYSVLGWRYEVAGAADPVVSTNVRWLAGYRHPRHGVPEIAAALLAEFEAASGLKAIRETIGPADPEPKPRRPRADRTDQVNELSLSISRVRTLIDHHHRGISQGATTTGTASSTPLCFYVAPRRQTGRVVE